jgi:hypothetical protein
MLAHRFSAEILGRLMIDGLAIAQPGIMPVNATPLSDG